MTVFTRSVQIMSRLKSIRTPPTGVLGAHRVVPNRFYTHCKKYAPLPDHTSSLRYNLYSALFSHCKYVKIDQNRDLRPGHGLCNLLNVLDLNLCENEKCGTPFHPWWRVARRGSRLGTGMRFSRHQHSPSPFTECVVVSYHEYRYRVN